jgi:predicted transcriptional regulator
MVTISLKLPPHDDARLRSLAKERRTTKSAIIRQAIQGLLRNSRPRKAQSFLDSAVDLAGILDGPGDLSTNPEHMKGFGK